MERTWGPEHKPVLPRALCLVVLFVASGTERR
jgi:hypothetical protein